MSTKNSSEERAAVLSGLLRGLYADNLEEIAKLAKGLARREQHNVATWALIYLGFFALARYWEGDPVDVETVKTFEKRVVSACEIAINDSTSYATENLARELVSALAGFDSAASR